MWGVSTEISHGAELMEIRRRLSGKIICCLKSVARFLQEVTSDREHQLRDMKSTIAWAQIQVFDTG